jgi:ligand-binding sensor domain-containing protein
MKTSRYALVALSVAPLLFLVLSVRSQFALTLPVDADALWVATHGQLFKLDPDQGNVEAQPANSSSIMKIAVDESDGTVWGYSRGKLTAYDNAGNLLISSTVPQTPANSSHIALTVDSSSGHVWLAIDKKLHQFDDQGQRIQTIALQDNAQDLAVDAVAGIVWIATEKSVKALDHNGDVVRTLKLPNKAFVKTIALDRISSSLWVALSDSLRVFNSGGTQILQKSIKGIHRLADDGDRSSTAAHQRNRTDARRTNSATHKDRLFCR